MSEKQRSLGKSTIPAFGTVSGVSPLAFFTHLNDDALFTSNGWT